jgi:dTDP-4-dehydrorhamnose reductase
MKILLFGKNGQVGWELNRSLLPLGEIIALAREQADFSKPESLRQIVRDVNPDVIVNAVAYTAVDKAEQEAGLATIVNEVATGVLAEEALRIDALLVHYSTDYIFDGTKTSPYVETDRPAPVNVYGRTKLAGEVAIQSSGCDYLIFRTSWVYAARGNNFLITILKLAQQRKELSIVNDQVGSPTSARLIADTTVLCVQQAMKEKIEGMFSSGLYHLTTSGNTSWYGFTKEIVKYAADSMNLHLTIKDINAIPTSEYPTPAKRPMNSQLELTKLETVFTIKMPDWKDALHQCMEEIAGL